MPQIGKQLILIGVLIALAGALIWKGVPLGRLPGDLHFKVGSSDIYIPLATSLLASAVISLVFWLFRNR